MNDDAFNRKAKQIHKEFLKDGNVDQLNLDMKNLELAEKIRTKTASRKERKVFLYGGYSD
jgi:hypothetical protein